MSKVFKMNDIIELREKEGRFIFDRLLIEPEFEESWTNGDIDAWLNALGLEYVGDHKFPTFKTHNTQERQKIILDLMSNLERLLKEEIELKNIKRRGWL